MKRLILANAPHEPAEGIFGEERCDPVLTSDRISNYNTMNAAHLTNRMIDKRIVSMFQRNPAGEFQKTPIRWVSGDARPRIGHKPLVFPYRQLQFYFSMGVAVIRACGTD